MSTSARSTRDAAGPSAKRVQTGPTILTFLRDKRRIEEAYHANDYAAIYKILSNVHDPLLFKYWTNSRDLQSKVWNGLLLNRSTTTVDFERFSKCFQPHIRQGMHDKFVVHDPKFVQDADRLEMFAETVVNEIRKNEVDLVAIMFANPLFAEYVDASPKLQHECWEACRSLGTRGKQMTSILNTHVSRKEDDEGGVEQGGPGKKKPAVVVIDDAEEEEEEEEEEELDSKPTGARAKADWKRVVELAKRGKFDEIDPEIQVRYFVNLQAIHKHANNRV